MADAVRDFAADSSEESWTRLQQTVLEAKEKDDGATDGGFR